MKTEFGRKALLLCASVSVAALSVAPSQAAFFALREQSAYNQGSSFAGASAQTNSLSSFFFNPAIMTEFEGFTAEGTLSAIFPFTDADTTVDPTTGAVTSGAAGASLIADDLSTFPTTSNIGREALLPASYVSYQATDKIWFGVALNSPFGLATRSDPDSLEAASSQEFSALTFNFQPTIAYKFSERFSVAAGLQVQHFDVEQSSATLAGVNTELNATGSSVGAIFGATFKPTDKTTIGLGYRSQMNVDLEGDIRTIVTDPGFVGLPAETIVGTAPARADLPLPDIVNLGIKHQLTEKLSLLGSFSWENWSRLQAVPVVTTGGATAAAFEFNLSDSFFGSAGAEYEINDHFTVRAGIGYETSPTNDEDRSLALPDNNRLWLSFGGTHKLSEHIESDFGFTYIRVEQDTPVSNEFQAPTTVAGAALTPLGLGGAPIASGTADSQVVIFTVGTRLKF
ncbi:MAG: outer membrane protein transport protein [Pseudomonadota bacterium]